MARRSVKFLMSALIVVAAGSIASRPTTTAQTEFTLEGSWVMTSSPINNEVVSRMGNTLGFPERHMSFSRDGDLLTGQVDREDAGPNVKPLGVWRVDGNRFSAVFQLWCEDSNFPCGSIVMRGEFTREDRVRGTMTAFWDEGDDTRPTGYDTWPMNFRGDRMP